MILDAMTARLASMAPVLLYPQRNVLRTASVPLPGRFVCLDPASLPRRPVPRTQIAVHQRFAPTEPVWFRLRNARPTPSVPAICSVSTASVCNAASTLTAAPMRFAAQALASLHAPRRSSVMASRSATAASVWQAMTVQTTLDVTTTRLAWTAFVFPPSARLDALRTISVRQDRFVPTELVSLPSAQPHALRTTSVPQDRSVPTELVLQRRRHAAQTQTALQAKSALMDLVL